MNRYQEKMNSFSYYFVEEQRTSLTQEYIQQLEELLNSMLPEGYKDFLVHYSLSAFDRYVYFPYLKDEKGILNVFFGIYPDDDYDLIDNYQSYQGRMPSNLFPIANDPGGNIITLSINYENPGAIYFWNHNGEIVVEQGEEIDKSNLYLLANSFDEFINSLEIEQDEDDDL